MRTPTLLLVVAAAFAVATVPASAQFASGSLILEAGESQDIAPGGTILVPMKLTYYGDITSYSRLSGIPVSYQVVNAPLWATVTLSRTSDVLVLPQQPSMYSYAMAVFDVRVDAQPSHNAASTVDQVRIAAIAQGDGIHSALYAEGAFPVKLLGTDDCPEHVVAEEPAAETASADDDLALQSVSAVPSARPLWPTVAACGVLGALVGAVLYRRLR